MHPYAQVIIDISLRELDRPFTYRIPRELAGRLRLGSLVVVPFGKGDVRRKGYVIGFADTCDLPEERVKEIADVALDGSDETGAYAIRLAAWMQERYGATMATALKTVLTGRRQAQPITTRSVRLLLGPEEAEEKLAFYKKKHQVARARALAGLMESPVQPYTLITGRLHVAPATMKAMEKAGVIKIETQQSLRNPVSLDESEGTKLTLSPQQEAIADGVLADFHAIREGRNGTPVSLIHGITGSGKTEVYIRIIERIAAEGFQAIMLIPEIALTYQTLLRFYRHFGDRVSVMNSTLSEGVKSDQFERARRGEIDVIIGPRSALFTPFPRIGVIVIDEEHETSYKNEQMPKYHAREVAEEIARMHGGVVVLGSATPSMDSYDRAVRGEYRLYRLDRRLTGGTLPSVEIADMREELRAGNRSVFSRRLAELTADRLARGEQTMLFLNRRGFSGFVSCRSCGYVPKCPHCSVSLSLHTGPSAPQAQYDASSASLSAREAVPEGRFSSGTGAAALSPCADVNPEGSIRPGNAKGVLVCHYCGYTEPMPAVCPECGSSHISGFRAGTQQVETMLKKSFPGARILRMDADTTRTKGSYEKLLAQFANEEADILIGTQMIVKGHDFPNVTLMGILLADMSLYVNDYRAAERTFQLLTQAAGRAGRGERPGEVVIQTYEPDNYAIVHAARQDYEGFYREEISYRRLLKYPPAAHLLAIQIASKNEDHAQLYAGQTRMLIEKLVQQWSGPGTAHQKGPGPSSGPGTAHRKASGPSSGEAEPGRMPSPGQDPVIIGPAAASLGKLRDEYRYAVYIKSADYDKLIACKDGVEAAAQRAKDASPQMDTYFQFDFDPVNPY